MSGDEFSDDSRTVVLPVEHGEQLATAWADTTLRTPEGLGHRRILRDPAVIADVVAFASVGVQPPVSDLVREVDRLLDV